MDHPAAGPPGRPDAQGVGLERIQPESIVLAVPFDGPQRQEADGQRLNRFPEFLREHALPFAVTLVDRHPVPPETAADQSFAPQYLQ